MSDVHKRGGGVDGGQGGKDAAALAGTLADEDASIALVAVTASDSAAEQQFDLGDDVSLPRLLLEERRLSGGQAQLIAVAAPTVAAGLESVALARRADLIVVGHSPRHEVMRIFANDDEASLTHQTPCAMAVAPANHADGPEPIARIGVAYDGSPESDVAVAHAGLLAGSFGAQLGLCHVLATPVDPAADLPRSAGLDITYVCGSVGDELVAFGAAVDLLICGSRHDGPLRPIAFGSTCDHLARRLATPLIVAPTIDTTRIELWQRARVNRSYERELHAAVA